jgi:hypothetical protein
MTLEPTRGQVPRTADPNRFPGSIGVTRPVVLLFGASLLLGGLLTAAPREIPGIAVAVIVGGAWLSLVLAMTLPRQSERAGQELVRRLAQFRHELNAIGDTPSAEALERMIARAKELGLKEDEVSEELAQIRACLEALDLKTRLARGEVPIAESLDPLPAGDACHFTCPVRFGRRRSDQFGHLVLTSGWLKFRGALDVSVAWSEVASVRRDGREILIRLQESRRVLRFSCHSHGEAARGGVLAEYLATAARVEEARAASEFHASV